MRIAGGEKLPCYVERASGWVIDLRGVKGNGGRGCTAAAWRHDLCTPHNENLAVRQKGRRVVGTSQDQRSGGTEMTRGRVENLRAAGRADASHQQHFAIGEQGGSVPSARSLHVSGHRESSGVRVIQLSA